MSLEAGQARQGGNGGAFSQLGYLIHKYILLKIAGGDYNQIYCNMLTIDI
jgi:hypothetical protein